ncbi:hypothetical protein G3I40_26045, partial [Streptomyces sp. SID14478]|uniref:triphosphoribosyl-dephospho-CoA synthase n=1 Tax=Streptomyces sp. SID14478 TaxID=2706073 RepID=UPI00141086ED
MLAGVPRPPYTPARRRAAPALRPAPLDALSGDELARAATSALTAEIVLTPKPGLPDCRGAAARQSSFHSFVDTGALLHEAFRECAAAATDINRLARACRTARAEIPHSGCGAGLDAAARVLCLLTAACGFGAANTADACRVAVDLGRAIDDRDARGRSCRAWS